MRRAIGVLVAGATAFSMAIPVRAATTATVRVDANAFSPFESAVDAGGTVTWLVQEGGHTVTADDGRFRFRGTSNTTLAPGTSVSFTFATDEYVAYHCEIHGGPGGQGMAGRVQVGVPTGPPPHDEPVIHVPGDAPDLAAALALAGPGHRVQLAPGDHAVAEPVEVAVDGVTISGAGASTRLVPTPGRHGLPSTALHVTASRVRIEQLWIGAFRKSGVHADGANAADLVDVDVDGAGLTLDALLFNGVTGATVRGGTASGSRRAGLHIADCATCGVLIDGVTSHDNGIGVLVEAARGVILRRSTLRRNTSGFVARADPATAALRGVSTRVVETTITNNKGGGVRVSGANDTLIARNVITGTFSWDGVGRNVRFVDNRNPAGAARQPTLDPAASLR